MRWCSEFVKKTKKRRQSCHRCSCGVAVQTPCLRHPLLNFTSVRSVTTSSLFVDSDSSCFHCSLSLSSSLCLQPICDDCRTQRIPPFFFCVLNRRSPTPSTLPSFLDLSVLQSCRLHFFSVHLFFFLLLHSGFCALFERHRVIENSASLLPLVSLCVCVLFSVHPFLPTSFGVPPDEDRDS